MPLLCLCIIIMRNAHIIAFEWCFCRSRPSRPSQTKLPLELYLPYSLHVQFPCFVRNNYIACCNRNLSAQSANSLCWVNKCLVFLLYQRHYYYIQLAWIHIYILPRKWVVSIYWWSSWNFYPPYPSYRVCLFLFYFHLPPRCWGQHWFSSATRNLMVRTRHTTHSRSKREFIRLQPVCYDSHVKLNHSSGKQNFQISNYKIIQNILLIISCMKTFFYKHIGHKYWISNLT